MVKAWACAADAATSDFVGFLADDNCLTPGFSKAMTDFFAEHPECDMAFGEQQIINHCGELDAQSSRRMSVEYGRSVLVRGILDPSTYGDLIRQNSIGFEACVVRRQALRDLGPFEPRAKGAFDTFFLWKALVSRRVVGYCPQAVMSFRLHAEQYSARAAMEHCDGALWVHEELLRTMPSGDPLESAIRASRMRMRVRRVRMGLGYSVRTALSKVTKRKVS